MENIKISDLSERITLANTEWIIDKELNRTEKVVPIRNVWANVVVKNSNYDNTETGSKPIIKYKVTIRKTDTEFTAVLWKNKRYELLQPRYVVGNKYICFEMSGIYGDNATEIT